MPSRRDLLKGAGAFMAAALSYNRTDAGILLPKRDLVTVDPANVCFIAEGTIREHTLEVYEDAIDVTPLDSRYLHRAPAYTHTTLQVLFDIEEIDFYQSDLYRSFIERQPLRIYIAGA